MSDALPRRKFRIGYVHVSLETLISHLRSLGRIHFEGVKPQDVVSYILSEEKKAIESHPDEEILLELDLVGTFHNPGVTFAVFRVETDSEYYARVKQNELRIKAEAERVAKRKASQEANEIKRYKELREKYGDTV